MFKLLFIIAIALLLYKAPIIAFTGLLCILGIFALLLFLYGFPGRFPRFRVDPSKLDIFFGSPGSGKTTLAAFFAAKALNCGIPVYSNVPIVGAFVLDKSDIGTWNIEGPALVIFDEGGAEFNSRKAI